MPAEPSDTDPDMHVSPRHPETEHPLRAGAPLWLRTEQSVAGEARALGLAAWAPGRISKSVSTTVPGAHRGTHSSGPGRKRSSGEVTPEGQFRWGDAA